MKVRELIEKLKKTDPERVVVLSSDEEGNNYNLLCEITEAAYKDDCSYGKIGLEKLTNGLKKSGYSEEDVMIDGVPAIVLYP